MTSGSMPISRKPSCATYGSASLSICIVDMYGGRRVFKGRVAGFTMGTGSTLALLPARKRDGQFHQSGAAVAGPD